MTDVQTTEPPHTLAARLFDVAPVPPIPAGVVLASLRVECTLDGALR